MDNIKNLAIKVIKVIKKILLGADAPVINILGQNYLSSSPSKNMFIFAWS